MGWINFAPTNGGVTVSEAGDFSGYAWGENIGWIKFNGTALNSTAYKVATAGPLAVTLADFSAVQQDDFVLLTWETDSELENRGFNLYRGTWDAGPDRQLNQTLIPSQSPGSSGGYVYTWEDRADLVPGTAYFYWVEDVDIHGATTDARPGERRFHRADRRGGHRAGREQHADGFPCLAGRAGGALGSLDGRGADPETPHGAN